MSMNAYHTIGFGLTGQGLLPIQQQWYDLEDYDSLNGGKLPGFPALELSNNSGEMSPQVWSILVRSTVVRIGHYDNPPTDFMLKPPTNGELTDIQQAGNAFVPDFEEVWLDTDDETLSPFGSWHVLTQVL